jgi:hypothetical protein
MIKTEANEPQTREYLRVNRQDWPSGPWDGEPDKVQWVDADTGLDCLMVRNGGGAWCGYVGVAEGHRFFGIDYSQCAQQPPCEESYCDHTPGSALSVHGGLTFADFCHEPTREKWEQWRVSLRGHVGESLQYPQGDAARAFRDYAHLLDDFEAWREFSEGRHVCHVPFAGRPARVWWLGFDCSHSDDRSPANLKWEREHGFMNYHDEYRDRAYVAAEVARLASQLAA